MLDDHGKVILDKRRSIRLPGVDYNTEGYYFVTICIDDRRCILGDVVAALANPSKTIVGAGHAPPAIVSEFAPSNIGMIIEKVWLAIPNHYSVVLNTFQIMPNHLHFIIEIAGAACGAPTLGEIVGSFKSEVTKQVRLYLREPHYTLWQRNYFEHIIRNEKELAYLQYYIEQNPNEWTIDEENPDRKQPVAK